ncbi:hypothetical protein RD792_017904 [Penstemon davidsonii]|uniref:Peptidase C14 caspase domain-containing protein n=1 Tax=Penstemon davidsonii TaxID=160366 RepID=A0ABR0DWJ1_9LAMI|nr:hypothetical protein RD792_017904 [Penstemon davidsonii]
MGKKMAVLVGCNYPTWNDLDKLDGCHTDVLLMRELLMDLMKMWKQIVPSDDNPITKMDFRHLVHRLPKNATFTILADSCNSGGLIDKEPEQVGPGHPVGQHGSSQAPPLTKKRKMIPIETLVQHLSALTGLESPDLGVHLLQHFGPDNCSILYRVPPHQHPKPLNKDQGILLSGCQSNESSYEGTNGFGEPCGQFDNAIQEMFKGSQKSLTNRMIIIKATKMLKDKRIMVQHPCLYCSKENADKDFLGVRFHK